MAVPFASMFKPGATTPKPSIDCPAASWEKFAVTTLGVQTGGVSVPVGVKVGVGGVPVTVGVDVGVNVAVLSVPVGVGVGGVIVPVGVKVDVASVPVGVGVGGVIVPVGVKVDVASVPVGVGVALWLPARLRKMTMVCEAAFPCTMVTLTVRAFRFLLIKRSAGIVYMSVTEYPARATSVIVNVPAST